MTVTQKASGQADAPELSSRWREQIKQSIEEGRVASVPGRGSVKLSFGLDLDRTPALLTEGEDLTLQIDWQDGDHWRNDPRWETDPCDRWDVHVALHFAGDKIIAKASSYEFGDTSRPDWLITRLLDIWHAKRLEA